ncbi:unnamed protein product, partial [Acanthoscelides obtectus]
VNVFSGTASCVSEDKFVGSKACGFVPCAIVALDSIGWDIKGVFVRIFRHVLWVQQQHEKRRKKRDYVDGRSVSPYSQYISEVAPSASEPHGQPHYRAIPSVSFPDPLFREQWYLCADFHSYKTRHCYNLVLPTNRLGRTNSEDIKLYNVLPDEVRSLQLSRFKCKLKSVLTRAWISSFQKYYALARDRQAFLNKFN